MMMVMNDYGKRNIGVVVEIEFCILIVVVV